MENERLILASASPRRADILRKAGFDIEILGADVVERSDGKAVETAAFNAKLKASAIAKMYTNRLIIAADTVVCFEGQLLGKPKNLKEAKETLLNLSGRTHEVYSAVCLCQGERSFQFTGVSKVKFKNFDSSTVDQYYSLVNPLDKAGGYNIDESGEMIIDSFEGEYENIMGLPIEKVKTHLEDFVK
jgi:septum formation protein